jgi:hypothetical protein
MMHNKEACNHFMQLIGNVKELYWEHDDILVQRDVEKWTCELCGETKFAIQENERELVDNQ